MNFPLSFPTPEIKDGGNEKSKGKIGEEWDKNNKRTFSLQPQTEGVAESKLCEELRSYGAIRRDKKFQCMSA